MRAETARGRIRIIRAVLMTVMSLFGSRPGTGEAQAPLGPAKTDSPVMLETPTGGFFLLDLTKQDDKTSPVIRLGYQVQIGDAVRHLREEDPDRDVKGVWYYALNLAGTPSDGVASIFGDGALSTGADLQLSIGQAYLQSYVTPLRRSDADIHIAELEELADAIEEEKAKKAPDPAVLIGRGTTARRVRDSLRAEMRRTRVGSIRVVYAAAIRYADDVIDYSAPAPRRKPRAPDQDFVLARRGGAIYDAWFLRLGARAGSATLFNAGSPFGEQFRDESYNGYSVQAGYSVRYGGSFPVTLAFSAGAERASNVDDLKSVEVAETQTFTSEDGVTRRQTTRKRNALVGEFEQSTNATGKLDIVLYPGLAAASRDPRNLKSTIAIDLFGRANQGERTIYGVGAYITRPGSPTSVYGGLNVYRAENAKVAISLSAGFPF